MPNQLKSRFYSYMMAVLLLVAFTVAVCLMFYKWVIGMAGLLVLVVLCFLLFWARRRHERYLETYISNLSHRVNKVGDEALTEMPIGILLYNENYQIVWANAYITSWLEGASFLGKSLEQISEALLTYIKGKATDEIVAIKNQSFHVVFHRNERLLYFFDVTESVQIQRLYQEEETVLGIIYLDNYEELTQGMEDHVRSRINSEVTTILKQWATDNGIYLKRSSAEKFFAVFNQRILKKLEREKFSVLDQVRESMVEEKTPITLSIGIGSGYLPLPELGELAQSSLDLTLGRGGDQVAVKQADGKLTFHGGKTNPIEKRTRVRARVISHALRDLILASDKVMIMGHAHPDMDAIGAAIGILKMVEANKKEGFIVLDKHQEEHGIKHLMSELKRDENLWSKFIPPDEAIEAASDDTLLVVVDTHMPSFVIEKRMINKTGQVVVIDHHRRGEEFITDPVLVYMEPYASSTAELVTELLEYQPSQLKLNVLEATALLAGIMVDTKNFTLRTGSRTFDAASFLRTHSADTVLVQRLLREDLNQYLARSRLIEDTEFYREGYAIALSTNGKGYDQVSLAQAADTLLAMRGVKASFVIAKRDDGKTAFSARSLGDVNVQIIMEALGGGGHLTNAAAQRDDITLAEAQRQLKAVIDETFKGGDSE